ncbi:hypothetical protein H1O16_gp029 [Burkholderia phage BcepSaruman]|uniref:Uncharacterized protein n=1 Tax=Burkholderia phage BcepSaruman TaxID=2530032 RepID=A0A4D5ZG19_9CAUD|nr:hypothetical protein H1O16_gp029 [Burkholderia phage BcepSaruman]QBX06442.1 hypothetical protein BcepSaruman_029 [Burkholderia phage BcepSaruman]
MVKITKTMQALLDARGDADSVPVTGARQAQAARALVDAGLARMYSNQSRVVSGTYYNHFTRRYESRAPRADIGGILYFHVMTNKG